MRSGIYEILNKVTGQRYVGSSKDAPDRMREHRTALQNGRHKNQRLMNSWRKYGADAFEFRQIVICHRHDLELYEQICIDGLHAYYELGGFNLRPMAFSPKGRKGSERQKQAMRERLGGTKNPILTAMLLQPDRRLASKAKLDVMRADCEVEARRAAAIRSHYADPAVRARQAAYVRGIKRSPETIAKLRIAATANAAKRKAAGHVYLRGADGRLTSAKTLSQTQIPGGNALGALLGGQGGGQ